MFLVYREFQIRLPPSTNEIYKLEFEAPQPQPTTTLSRKGIGILIAAIDDLEFIYPQ